MSVAQRLGLIAVVLAGALAAPTGAAAESKRCGTALGVAVTVTKSADDLACNVARRVVRAGLGGGESRNCGGAQQGACAAIGSWRCRVGTAAESARGRDGYCYVPKTSSNRRLARDRSRYTPSKWKLAISLKRPARGGSAELAGEREVGGVLVSGANCPYPSSSPCVMQIRGAPANGYYPFVVPAGGTGGFAPLVPVGGPPFRARNDGTGRWVLRLPYRCSSTGSRGLVVYDSGAEQRPERYTVTGTCAAR